MEGERVRHIRTQAKFRMRARGEQGKQLWKKVILEIISVCAAKMFYLNLSKIFFLSLCLVFQQNSSNCALYCQTCTVVFYLISHLLSPSRPSVSYDDCEQPQWDYYSMSFKSQMLWGEKTWRGRFRAPLNTITKVLYFACHFPLASAVDWNSKRWESV